MSKMLNTVHDEFTVLLCLIFMVRGLTDSKKCRI